VGAKKLKLHRVRTDGAYIFAALFAMFGSYALLGSYADSKPLKSYEPGVYQLSDFKTKDAGVYRLGLKMGQRYCLSPVTLTQTDQSVLIAGDKMGRSMLMTADNAVCFITDANYSRVNVQLPHDALTATTLTVSSQ